MRRFHVLTAELQHETNTFCVLPTGYEEFVHRSLLLGDAAIAARSEHNTALAGFLDISRTHSWRVTHALSADAPPGGCVTRDAFERLTAPIIAAAVEHKDTIDGIFLGLHGAMVTDFCEDGEGELLRRLRAQVGSALPIAITLDPHANVSRSMCDHAQIMVAFKTYPHVDMRIAGRQAADILQRTMAGEIAPRTLRVSRPMLEEANGGRTDLGPMLERIARARAYERQADVFAVSVNGGFANADIAEVGPNVLVTAQGDLAQHARFASELADHIWARRSERLESFYTVQEAASICKTYAQDSANSKPIVVADYADNPGGGAYGDSTALLQALIQADVPQACFGPMVDAETVQQLQKHQLGETVALHLGGKTDPRFGGMPLDVNGTLLRLSDGIYVGTGAMLGGLQRSWGATAVVRVGAIEILIVSQRSQMLDLAQFKTFGIEPESKRVVALKSMQHFRAAFEPMAGQVIVCDSGALCTMDYSRLPFAKVPRPVFPLDKQINMDEWMHNNAQGIYIPAASK
jgi:microcystin degradation protein MlrC